MGWRRANRAAGLRVALWFFGRAHGFDGNGRREWTGRFQRNRGAGSLVSRGDRFNAIGAVKDRKSTRLNSSHRCISYAVFCLKKKNKRGTKEQRHRGYSRR